MFKRLPIPPHISKVKARFELAVTDLRSVAFYHLAISPYITAVA